MRLFLLLGVVALGAGACTSSYLGTAGEPGKETRGALAVATAEPKARPALCSTRPVLEAAVPARAQMPGTFRWSRHYGGPGNDEAAAVALDPAGNIVIAGQFTGSMDMGSRTLEGRGPSEAFVAKLSPAGELIWVRTLGSQGTDFASAVAVDTAGNIIVLGGFEGRMEFAGSALRSRGMSDLFVVSYSHEGKESWARSLGGPSWELAASLAVDMSGDILVAGAFEHTLAVADRVLESEGDADAFAVRLAPDGSHIWSIRLGGEGWDEANAIAVDANGNAIVAGALSNKDGSHGFVSKYSSEGASLWNQRFTGTASDRALAVAAAPGGAILVAGTFAGAVDLGGERLDSAGKHDLFLASYDPDGRHRWSRRFGGSQGDCARAIALDGERFFVVAGSISGEVSVGGNTLHAGQLDMFVARYSITGEHVWSQSFPGAGAGTRSLVTTAEGAIVAAGSFPYSIDFGGESSLKSAGAFDAFVVALTPTRPRLLHRH
jgi:hypothetical protein